VSNNGDIKNDVDFQKIFNVYQELFPNDVEFIVLYSLFKVFGSTEIEYIEIKFTITNASKLSFLNNGREVQVERIFKNLLGTFIERIPGKFNRFVLTPHSEKIIEIVLNRIHNPYLQFPLKDTFETYFKLPENAADHISELQRWFKLGFENTARQVVIGHLEGLKFSVDEAIKELNKVLEADDLSAIKMLERFSANFSVLGDKARQISEAIRMKVDVYYSLRNISDAYGSKVSQILHLNTEQEIEENKIAKINRDIATGIKEEVYLFFEKVDKQLDFINSKMTFAGLKIAELHDSLKAQSHYKISLKKLLLFLLNNSSTDRQNNITLPDNFPKKSIINEKFRFVSLRYWDMGFLKKGTPIEQKLDGEYETIQRKKFELELAKQELVQKLCEQALADLSLNKKIDLSSRLFDIMEKEHGLDVAVQTGFDFIRSLGSENEISIKEELQTNKEKSIYLWKVLIQSNRDLTS